MRVIRWAALAACAVAAPAFAQPFVFSGTVEGRVGYVTNPFLNQGGSGSGLAGVTLAPAFTRTTATGATTFSGLYDREQYFTRYGYSETFQADALHAQQLSERLTGRIHAAYVNTNNATFGGNFTPGLNDLFTVGQRSWRLTGDGSLAWQPTARDQFTVGASATHVEYDGNRLIVSDYDQYTASLDYLHTLNARTKVGGTVSYVRYLAKNYPDSTAIQPGIKLEQVLSPAWTFTGDVGVILQKVDGEGHTSTGLGFHASLCGTYPMRTICFRGARSSSATGIGGLSNTTSLGVDYSQRLGERDTLTVGANYETTRYRRSAIGGLDARFLLARADYSRTLTQRLSAGVGGRYQVRDTSDFGSEHSIAVTANLRLKIGRIS